MGRGVYPKRAWGYLEGHEGGDTTLRGLGDTSEGDRRPPKRPEGRHQQEHVGSTQRDPKGDGGLRRIWGTEVWVSAGLRGKAETRSISKEKKCFCPVFPYIYFTGTGQKPVHEPSFWGETSPKTAIARLPLGRGSDVQPFSGQPESVPTRTHGVLLFENRKIDICWWAANG